VCARAKRGGVGEVETWMVRPSERRRTTLVVSVWAKDSVTHDTTSPRRMPARICTYMQQCIRARARGFFLIKKMVQRLCEVAAAHVAAPRIFVAYIGVQRYI